MRIQIPYIEALRKQKEGKFEKPIPTEKVERDLTPKSMKDSYHRVVRISKQTNRRKFCKSLCGTNAILDSTAGTRPMASRLVYQFLGAHPSRHSLHGP